MTNSTVPAPPRYKAIAFDPKSPATLLLPNNSTTTTTTTTTESITTFETFLSHDGVGSNPNETSALLLILDAYETHFKTSLSMENSYESDDEEEEQYKAEQRLKLSKKYRSYLQSCMEQWEQRLSSSSSMEEEEEKDEEGEEYHLELLKLMYAITHLSEIYLLQRPSSTSTSLLGGSDMDTPGSVTSDTVRYLRLHHMTSPYDDFQEEEENTSSKEDVIEEMLSSSQPEYYPNDLYWKLLRKLTLRGCLEDVWAIVSRHSACRRCVATMDKEEEGGGEYYDTIKQDRDAFAILHALLISAPLPGGRNDALDDCLGTIKQEEEEAEEMLMEGITTTSYKLWDQDVTNDDDVDDDGNKNTKVLPTTNRFNPHLASSLHKHWMDSVRNAVSSPPLSQLCKRIPRLYRDVLSIILGESTSLSASVVENADSWSEALASELLYQRPHLRPSDVHVRSARHMEQFGVLKRKSDDESSNSGGFEEIVLSVMKGNAGRVVEALHDLGGGSGAALPATMTALLCNLLTEANQIQPSISSTTESFNIQTELLLLASHSIPSSFSTQNHSEVGVRLATRLLLPFAFPPTPSFSSKKDDSSFLRITHQLATILDTHMPNNDADTKHLLKLVTPLIVKHGSKVMLDACENLIRCRFQYYMKDNRPGGAIYWLLRGMELNALLPRTQNDGEKQKNNKEQQRYYSGVVSSNSPSKRHFTLFCTSTASNLLKALVANTSVNDVVCYLNIAQEIIQSIQDDDEKIDNEMNDTATTGKEHIRISTIVSHYREVQLLHCIVNIALGMMKQKDKEVGVHVIRCLEERVLATEEERFHGTTNNSAVLTLAHPIMYDDLLCLAYAILEGEEELESGAIAEEDDGSSTNTTATAFNVHGIHILMARLSQLIEWEHFEIKRLSSSAEQEEDENDEDEGNSMMHDDDKNKKMNNSQNEKDVDTTKLTYTVPQMRLSLCKGLARAFVSENSLKQQKNDYSMMSEDVQELNASFIALGREEKNLELMLAPPTM